MKDLSKVEALSATVCTVVGTSSHVNRTMNTEVRHDSRALVESDWT
jgi:hypothetical protein